MDKTKSLHLKKISIDLIYGLPGQKIEDWEKNLEKAVSLPVEHISAYHLTYEKGTRFYKWLKECKMSEADENLSLDFFHATIKILEREGFDHYEISNFARNNQYSRHNIKYWLGEQYLGIGPSAHSYNGIVRQWNIADFDRWMKNDQENSEVLKSEKIDREIRRNEMIMTRLRTKWGIPQAEFIELFGYEAWEKLLELITPFLIGNFVEYKNNKIVLTQKGKFLADGIIADLFILAKA